MISMDDTFAWGKSIVAIIATSALCFALFMAANASILLTDNSRIAQEIDRSVRAGLLDETGRVYPIQRGAWKFWGHTECLILWMAAAPDRPLRRLVLPLVPVLVEGGDACDGLKARATGANVESTYYPRYLHGYRVATAWLLSLLSPEQLPRALLIGVYALPLAGLTAALGLAMQRRRHGGRVPPRLLGHAVVNVLFITAFGLSYFGRLVTFAFGDFAVMLFWQIFLFLDPVQMSRMRVIVLMAGFGAIVAYFEFLTGQIPLALALIIAVFTLWADGKTSVREVLLRVLWSLIAFVGAVFVALALQQIAVAIVFGYDPSFLARLSEWTSSAAVAPDFSPHELDILKRLHLDGYLLSGRSPPLLVLPVRIGFALGFAGLGSTGIAFGLFAVALALLGWGCVVGLRSGLPILRMRVQLTLCSLAMPLAWYLVFTAHAIKHNLQMARPLVFVPMAAAVLALHVLSVVRGKPAPKCGHHGQG